MKAITNSFAGRPKKKFKADVENKNDNVIKKENMDSSEKEETILIETADKTKKHAAMKPVRLVSENPNEICFEIITSSKDHDPSEQITIVENVLEGNDDNKNTSDIIDDSTTIVHDISSLPASLQALVQAATATMGKKSASESKVNSKAVENESETVFKVVNTSHQDQAEEVSKLVDMDTQDVVLAKVEETGTMTTDKMANTATPKETEGSVTPSQSDNVIEIVAQPQVTEEIQILESSIEELESLESPNVVVSTVEEVVEEEES